MLSSPAAQQTSNKPVDLNADVPAAPAAGGDGAQKPMANDGQQQVADGEAGISGAPEVQSASLLRKHERIEYRDQHGNILNEEQVKELEGKVEFKTKYETKTRVVDEYGNEVRVDLDANGEVVGEPEVVAPPHPDVQNVDQETRKEQQAEHEQHEGVAGDAKADESVKGEREAEQKKPKPASENGPEASS